MSTQVATKAAKATTSDEAKPKAPRSFGQTLHGTDGEVLRVVAVFRRDGSARTFVVHSTAKDAKGKRANQRGATQTFATSKEAVAAVERVAQAALAKGWARRERVAGFAAKPDAFDLAHLPAPLKSKKR